eukprot:EC119005.1.p1 GENE.EC119005.1~~EC119005.1.p1  ORF type:complete len:106 (+),score=17.58 EC119005.1:159-476(+)
MSSDTVKYVSSLIIAAGTGAALATLLVKQSASSPAAEPAYKPINSQDFPVKASETVESGKTIAVCRCWQSEKFPYCDGSHNQVNSKGDKVGPYVVTAGPSSTPPS